MTALQSDLERELSLFRSSEHACDDAAPFGAVPHLSIVIPVWNSGPRICQTVEALQRMLSDYG